MSSLTGQGQRELQLCVLQKRFLTEVSFFSAAADGGRDLGEIL